jgi:hypothetical protein
MAALKPVAVSSSPSANHAFVCLRGTRLPQQDLSKPPRIWSGAVLFFARSMFRGVALLVFGTQVVRFHALRRQRGGVNARFWPV